MTYRTHGVSARFSLAISTRTTAHRLRTDGNEQAIFVYRRATSSTKHRSVKFLDGVQALRGWDGTIFGLSASVSTSYAAGSPYNP